MVSDKSKPVESTASAFVDGKVDACYDPITGGVGGGGGDGRWMCRIPAMLLAQLWQHVPSKYYQSFTAREVAENATVVYYGVRIKDGKDAPAPWGYCFVGVPERVRVGPSGGPNGGAVDLPKGYVFTAYVSQGGDVFEWRLELADPRDPSLPLERGPERFPGGVVWQRND